VRKAIRADTLVFDELWRAHLFSHPSRIAVADGCGGGCARPNKQPGCFVAGVADPTFVDLHRSGWRVKAMRPGAAERPLLNN
jgi:hypothetical protein